MPKILVSSMLAATMLSSGALAQSGGVDEIIVTAQKRAQNLQDVPIAISALSPDYLEKRDITSISSLTGLAPNLKVNSTGANRTTSTISIRGGVQGNPQLYFEPSVGLYMDGVYIAKAQGSVFDVADVERIEVLRGPQGTLYGRNAVAGAINIITRKPTGELGGRLEASYGNYNYWRLRGTLDLPRLGIFSAKISGQITEHDGFYKVEDNLFTREAQDLNSKTGMVQLRAEPGDNLTFDYTFDISVNDQQAAPAQAVVGTGSLAPYVTPPKRQKTVRFNSPSHEFAKNWGHALTVALELGDTATIKSITALRKQRYKDALDLDGTPVLLGQSSRDSRYKQFSQELQVVGEVGKLNYVVGGYYFEDHGFVYNPQTFFYGASISDSRFGFSTKAYAAYAQADYHLTDALTLTAGLRYTHEKKTVERFLARTTAAGTATVVDLPKGAVPPENFSKFSPTVTLSYEVDPDLNLYARYAQGYRSGGFNAVSNTEADVRRIFRPETQNTYEIGIKSRLFDRRLQLNLAAFRNEMNDLQLTVFVPGLSVASILDNAGKARTQGVEAEATFQPNDSLTLQASVGYLHSKYLSYIDSGVDVSKNRTYPHAPNWTLSTSVDWKVAEWEWGRANVIVDYNLTSSFYSNPVSLTNAHLVHVPSQSLLDARLLLGDLPVGSAKAEVSLWAKNILNEKDPNFFINFGPAFQNLDTAFFPDPRTFGVTFNIRY